MFSQLGAQRLDRINVPGFCEHWNLSGKAYTSPCRFFKANIGRFLLFFIELSTEHDWRPLSEGCILWSLRDS